MHPTKCIETSAVTHSLSSSSSVPAVNTAVSAVGGRVFRSEGSAFSPWVPCQPAPGEKKPVTAAVAHTFVAPTQEVAFSTIAQEAAHQAQQAAHQAIVRESPPSATSCSIGVVEHVPQLPSAAARGCCLFDFCRVLFCRGCSAAR